MDTPELLNCFEYIQENESFDENFSMPTAYQQTINTITSEVLDYLGDSINDDELMEQVQELQMSQGQQQQGGQGGGIDKIEGPFWFVIWFLGIRMGYYWNVWFSDETCKRLNTVSLVTYLFSLLGPYGVILAFMIQAYIIIIANANEGNGVFFQAILYLYPGPFVGLGGLKPQ